MKKLLLATILLLLMFVFGCSGSNELKDFASKEKDWLNQLQPIVAQIRIDYASWESGQISKEQLSEKLSIHYPKVKELRNQYSQYRSDVKLSDKAKKDDLYTKGLGYGDSIRLNVESFLFYATKPISDSDLKQLYETEMKKGYNRKLELLQSAIDKLLK
ncbi:MAG: hypothetical protein C4589_11010 [Peptococcaceae bacterium]|nr:MAG: hypothetical protein C4589_11010 [Peptococcaceae bacterium]